MCYTVVMDSEIDEERLKFGRLVRSIRLDRKMTLKQVADRLKVTVPAIIAVEKGRRATGENLACRLAEAFDLLEGGRSNFMRMSVTTRLRDRLTGVAGRVPPELTHCLVELLSEAGIDPCNIGTIVCHRNPGKLPSGKCGLEIVSNDGKGIVCVINILPGR